MDYQILKCLLNHAFWLDNSQYLNASLFEDEIRELFEVLNQAHDKYEQDITIGELLPLWSNINPVATSANKANIHEVITRIANSEALSYNIATDLIADLWRRETGRKAAEYGIAIAEGNTIAFDKLDRLIQNTKDGFIPELEGEDTTTDIYELLSVVSDENRWKFNIESLSNAVYGLAPGEFGFALARTNAGKTAFGVSLACSPNGFVEQGAKVAILTNEEDSRRTMLRAIQSYTGFDKTRIMLEPEQAMTMFNNAIAPNLMIRDIAGWTFQDISVYLEKKKPNVVIIDMLDKIVIPNSSGLPSHERLKEVYTKARELCSFKNHNCALLGMSQASDAATGKTIVTPDMAEGSKTAKGAEADLILGIGMYPMDTNGRIDPIRYITIGKNKINGVHMTVSCLLKSEISRYID